MPNISLLNSILKSNSNELKNIDDEKCGGDTLQHSQSNGDVKETSSEFLLNDLDSYKNGNSLSHGLLYIDEECDDDDDDEQSEQMACKDEFDKSIKNINESIRKIEMLNSNVAKSGSKSSLYKNKSLDECFANEQSMTTTLIQGSPSLYNQIGRQSVTSMSY